MIRPIFFLSAAAAVTASPAVAQTGNETAAPSIIVSGGSLPLPPGTPAYGSVTVDRDTLSNSASNRIENVLAGVAGFQQFRRSDSRSANPSAQGATLRALGGNASSRTLVLLDGVPVADPFFGYIPFNALVPDRLSLIRVTRGGGIGAFGAGAVAGTVELASATRTELPRAEASAFYGSRDATELSAALSPDLGTGFVSVSGRWDRGDGFRTTPKSQLGAASVPAAYDNWSGAVRAVAPLSQDFELQARAVIFRDDRTLRFAGADSHSEGQDASIRLIGRGAWQVDALAYVQARNFSNIVISSTSFRKVLDQRNTPSTGLGGKLELRPPVGESHLLRVGVDTRFSTGDMYETPYSGFTGLATAHRQAGGDQHVTGLFVEDDWTLGRLILTGGVRADHWRITEGFYKERDPGGALTQDTIHPDRTGWEFNGRAGVLFQAHDAVMLRAAGYTGFRLPTLNELYRPFVVFPVVTEANAGLKPERLRGIEGGVDLLPAEGVKLSATVFHNRLKGAVANVTIGTNLRQRQNVDAVKTKGVELTTSADIGDVSLLASYAYNDASVDAPGQAFDGLRPAQTPRHAASAMVSWEPLQGPALSATLRYTGKQYEDDLQTDALPHALTVDGVARMPLGHGISLVARAENIFDEKVETRNAGGSIDLGTPRTLWIGIRFAQ